MLNGLVPTVVGTQPTLAKESMSMIPASTWMSGVSCSYCSYRLCISFHNSRSKSGWKTPWVPRTVNEPIPRRSRSCGWIWQKLSTFLSLHGGWNWLKLVDPAGLPRNGQQPCSNWELCPARKCSPKLMHLPATAINRWWMFHPGDPANRPTPVTVNPRSGVHEMGTAVSCSW